MQWFEVDKKGLAAIMHRRGKRFVIFELLQNAWDENSTKVDVTVSKDPGSRLVTLRVEDDNPEGFSNLSHAFTLFAESSKKGDPEKRGRFNLGEKLVLALCESASINTTKGSVIFDKDGRSVGRKKREAGSVFEGQIRMTNEEFVEFADAARSVIPPEGIKTTFNGEPLQARQPIAEIEATLPTEVTDADGRLVRTARKTAVRVYEPLPGYAPCLYEMGIPVCETGDRFDVEIRQKIPLNMERDGVSAGYLKTVRTLVVNSVVDRLTRDDVNLPWVRDALSDERCTDEAAKRIVSLRFGDKVVVASPNDPESASRAFRDGYTVVHGGQFSSSEWATVRRAGAIPASSLATPSPKPFSADGKPLRLIDPEKWTPEVARFARYASKVAEAILRVNALRVMITSDVGWGFGGAYSKGGQLYVNLGRLGHAWFADFASERMNQFLIHEFGHEHASDHMSDEYHDALCRLGAKLSRLALDSPEIFDASHYEYDCEQHTRAMPRLR